MKHSILAGSVATCIFLGIAAPLLAAQAAESGTAAPPPSTAPNVSAAKPAQKCLSDVRAFDIEMSKDGYWLGGSRFGYGYPMGGYGYGPPINGRPGMMASGYLRARPGYEVRTLLASASILAENGQQQSCENVLATTRDIYKVYVTDMHTRGLSGVNEPGWRPQQIATAQPVADDKAPLQSGELLDTDVRSPQNVGLGSVHDIVMSPQTGKIAYIIIARGGIFGIGEKYVAVPWTDFKITENATLLVLDTTTSAMSAAPEVNDGQLTTPAQFADMSQKADAYWKTHLTSTGNNGSKR
jgi:sporulation protein YlmC with PRC-barrel domain